MLDYYAILGVAPDASIEEIKAARKRALLYWHPDKNKSPEANIYTLRIMEAYSCLSDDEARGLYDQSRVLYDNASPDGDDEQEFRPTGSVLTDMGKETPKAWKIYQWIFLILIQLLWLVVR